MSKYKIKVLDYLKGIMALGIVIYHYNIFTSTPHNDSNFPLYNILNIFYTNGNILVELFFLISGFCFFTFYSENITNNKIKGKEFFLKRFLRLYPLYIITTIIILILNFFNVITLNINIITILLNIFCLSRGWINNKYYPYNLPAWFLNVIIFDYIIFYFINKFIKNKKIKIIIMISLIILGLICKIGNLQYPILNVEMGRGLTNFFLGGIIAYICNCDCIKHKKNIKKIALCLIILGLIIAVPLIEFKFSYYIIVLIVFPSILLFSILIDRYVPEIKVLSFLGKVSFSIYLWHYCYIYFIKMLHIDFDYYSIIFLIIYLITLIGLSYISYLFIEQKLSKYLEQKFINKIN